MALVSPLRIAVLVIAGMLSVSGALAQSQVVTRTVAGVEIVFPLLQGLLNPDSVPLYMQTAIEQNYRGSRLLAFYRSEADSSDAGASNRFLVVLAKRAERPISMSATEMEKLKVVLRESAVAAVRVDLPAGADDAAAVAEMKRRLEAPSLRIAEGAELLLGVFDERPGSITLATVQRPRQPKGAQAIATAMTQLALKGASISVFANSPYRSQRDVQWVLNVTRVWMEQLEAANRE